MKKARKYTVTVSKTVEILFDEKVLDQGLREDNPIFGKDVTLGMVVRHLAYNLVANDLRLSQIDGYANLKDDQVKVGRGDWDVEVDRGEPL